MKPDRAFRQRFATAAVLLLISLLALFYFPQAAWFALVFTLVAIGAWEWAGLAGWARVVRALYTASTAAMCLAAASLLPWESRIRLAPFAAAFAFWALIAPLWLVREWKTHSALVLALLGFLVLIPFGLALIALRAISPWLLLQILSVVWVADSAAYFFGRSFGKTRLAPVISPGKTWEGALGSLFTVAIYAAGWFMLERNSDYGERMVLGLAQSISLLLLVPASIVGDLFESWLKRQADVKDSGTLLPGHGGLLDRIDGLTAALPVAAFTILFLR